MDKEWIKGIEGKNLKFKREYLLNSAINRWRLNQTHSVGPTSKLIRQCSPRSFEEWESFYFKNACQKKKNGINIDREYISKLGKTLYIRLMEDVQNEIKSITEEECIDYAYNLVINRTYEGYIREIDTIYGELQSILGYKIESASDEWDRLFNVDFFIEINGKYIGLQIKPVGNVSHIPQIYKEIALQEETHKNFQNKYGGKVFYIFSIKKRGNKAVIQNKEIIPEIEQEIERLEAINR
jgi:MjaI-like restriction endonuclease